MYHQQNRHKILEGKVLILRKIVALLCDITKLLTLMLFTFIIVPGVSRLNYFMYSYLVYINPFQWFPSLGVRACKGSLEKSEVSSVD